MTSWMNVPLVAVINQVIYAAVIACRDLLEATIDDALASADRLSTGLHDQLTLKIGKSDTLGLDLIPESAILDIVGRIPETSLITEERGVSSRSQLRHLRTGQWAVVADPTDGSRQLRQFLELIPHESRQQRLGDVLTTAAARQRWSAMYPPDAAITAAIVAVTLMERGVPVCSVLINYLTTDLLLLCPGGIWRTLLPHYSAMESQCPTLEKIFAEGSQVQFRPRGHHSAADHNRFVTFLGKSGYPDNLKSAKLFGAHDLPSSLYLDPTGPARWLFLTHLYSGNPVGFIIANGERLGEWVHWITAVRFARCGGGSLLRLFEVINPEAPQKESFPMAALNEGYSVFQEDDVRAGCARIDTHFLSRFRNPSRLRSTLIMAGTENHWVRETIQHQGWPERTFDPEPTFN